MSRLLPEKTYQSANSTKAVNTDLAFWLVYHLEWILINNSLVTYLCNHFV